MEENYLSKIMKIPGRVLGFMFAAPTMERFKIIKNGGETVITPSSYNSYCNKVKRNYSTSIGEDTSMGMFGGCFMNALLSPGYLWLSAKLLSEKDLGT